MRKIKISKKLPLHLRIMQCWDNASAKQFRDYFSGSTGELTADAYDELLSQLPSDIQQFATEFQNGTLHLAKYSLPRCGNKSSYPDKSLAESIASSRTHANLRVYNCDKCYNWHLTSQPLATHRRGKLMAELALKIKNQSIINSF